MSKPTKADATSRSSASSSSPESSISRFGSLKGSLAEFNESMKDARLYRASSKKSAARLLPVLLPVVFVSSLDRAAIAYTAGEMQYLDSETSQYGWAVGIFFLPYVALQFPSLWVARATSVRWWLFTLILVWAAAAATTATTFNGGKLLMARVVLGSAQAGILPIIYYYLDLFLTPGDMVHLWSIGVLVAQQVGSILCGPLVALVLWQMKDLWGLHGWQWVYILDAILVLFVGLLVLVALPSPPSQTSILTAEERGAVMRMRANVSGLDDAEAKADLSVALSSWKSWYLGAMGMLANGPAVMFQFFIPILLADMFSPGISRNQVDQMSPTTSTENMLISLLSSVPLILLTASLLLQSWLLRYRPRITRLWAGSVVICVTLVLCLGYPLPLSTNITWLQFCYLSLLVAVYTPFLYTESLPAFYLQLKGASAAYFAIYSSIKNISSIWTPPLIVYMTTTVKYSGSAVQIIGAMHLVPFLLMYILFFHLVERTLQKNRQSVV